MLGEIIDLIFTTFWMILGIAAIFAIYLIVSGLCNFAYSIYSRTKMLRLDLVA